MMAYLCCLLMGFSPFFNAFESQMLRQNFSFRSATGFGACVVFGFYPVFAISPFFSALIFPLNCP